MDENNYTVDKRGCVTIKTPVPYKNSAESLLVRIFIVMVAFDIILLFRNFKLLIIIPFANAIILWIIRTVINDHIVHFVREYARTPYALPCQRSNEEIVSIISSSFFSMNMTLALDKQAITIRHRTEKGSVLKYEVLISHVENFFVVVPYETEYKTYDITVEDVPKIAYVIQQALMANQ